MKLWLDDKRPMPSDFDRHVKTYQDAINAIETGEVTHIGFDHDLGDESDPEIRNGYQVAKHIEERAYNGVLTRIIWSIQSDNGPGRRNIEVAMKNADRFWEWHENKLDENGKSLMKRYYGHIESVDPVKKTFSFRFDDEEGTKTWAGFLFSEVDDEKAIVDHSYWVWVIDGQLEQSKLHPLQLRHTKRNIEDANGWMKVLEEKGFFDKNQTPFFRV